MSSQFVVFADVAAVDVDAITVGSAAPSVEKPILPEKNNKVPQYTWIYVLW